MRNNIWENKLAEAQSIFEGAKREVKIAELKLKENEQKEGIERWLGYTFESSSSLTPEFAEFRREIKRYIKKSLTDDLELIMPFGSLHFAFSGFIKNKITGRFVYFSCSDVRSWSDGWYNDLLIRTAENEKDYTGGSNNSCKLPELSKKAKELTN